MQQQNDKPIAELIQFPVGRARGGHEVTRRPNTGFPGTYARIASRAESDTRLTARDWRVLAWIGKRELHGKVQASLCSSRRIGKDTGMGSSHVRESLIRLETYGYLEREDAGANRKELRIVGSPDSTSTRTNSGTQVGQPSLRRDTYPTSVPLVGHSSCPVDGTTSCPSGGTSPPTPPHKELSPNTSPMGEGDRCNLDRVVENQRPEPKTTPSPEPLNLGPEPNPEPKRDTFTVQQDHDRKVAEHFEQLVLLGESLTPKVPLRRTLPMLMNLGPIWSEWRKTPTEALEWGVRQISVDIKARPNKPVHRAELLFQDILQAAGEWESRHAASQGKTTIQAPAPSAPEKARTVEPVKPAAPSKSVPEWWARTLIEVQKIADPATFRRWFRDLEAGELGHLTARDEFDEQIIRRNYADFIVWQIEAATGEKVEVVLTH